MPLNASVPRRLSWSIDRRSVCGNHPIRCLKICHLTYGIIHRRDVQGSLKSTTCRVRSIPVGLQAIVTFTIQQRTLL